MTNRQNLLNPYLFYQLFKYLIYSLLLVNLVLFIQENITASSYTFAAGVPYSQYIEAYSDSIDTASWVLLLLLFELETYVLSDEQLTRRLTIGLFAIRTFCYLFICYSLYGYLSRYLSVLSVEAFQVSDICTLVDSSFTYMVNLNDYQPLSAAACAELQQHSLVRLVGTDIIGSQESYQVIHNLAMVDVINASAWVLIVVILELDVYLQTRHQLRGPFVAISGWIKIGLYLTLLSCALYWWIDGDFLDFWDAFLWLIAFVFIEMNIFEWQKELEENRR